jgi:hypothetical protein
MHKSRQDLAEDAKGASWAYARLSSELYYLHRGECTLPLNKQSIHLHWQFEHMSGLQRNQRHSVPKQQQSTRYLAILGFLDAWVDSHSSQTCSRALTQTLAGNVSSKYI